MWGGGGGGGAGGSLMHTPSRALPAVQRGQRLARVANQEGVPASCEHLVFYATADVVLPGLDVERGVFGEVLPGFSLPSASKVASTPRLNPQIAGLRFSKCRPFLNVGTVQYCHRTIKNVFARATPEADDGWD